jgi:DNA-binding HxlR family transcriptional regulator
MEGRYPMDTVESDSTWTVPDVECPSRTVLEVLANKWVLYVLGALRQEGEPMRFNQLGRALPGVTQKMLTQTLRTLERDGLLARQVYPTVPPRVEYGLTALGHEAGRLTVLIGEWALAHVDQIVTARTEFDHQATEEPAPLD